MYMLFRPSYVPLSDTKETIVDHDHLVWVLKYIQWCVSNKRTGQGHLRVNLFISGVALSEQLLLRVKPKEFISCIIEEQIIAYSYHPSPEIKISVSYTVIDGARNIMGYEWKTFVHFVHILLNFIIIHICHYIFIYGLLIIILLHHGSIGIFIWTVT